MSELSVYVSPPASHLFLEIKNSKYVTLPVSHLFQVITSLNCLGCLLVHCKMTNRVGLTCDMIKGYHSDVTNSDCELQAKREDNFLYFPLFRNLKIVHINAIRCSDVIGFGSKCSILNGKVVYITF